MASSTHGTTLARVFRQDRKPPRRRGIDLMEAHVEELCREHGIQLARASSRGRAIRWQGGKLEISIPPIRGQVSYFIALHEIGHLVGRGRSAPRLESEANAWLWHRLGIKHYLRLKVTGNDTTLTAERAIPMTV